MCEAGAAAAAHSVFFATSDLSHQSVEGGPDRAISSRPGSEVHTRQLWLVRVNNVHYVSN